MRTNFPDRQTLERMPLYRLRNLDIHDKEEEVLVQEVVSQKLREMPLAEIPPVPGLRGKDIKTPEEEKAWQSKMDEKVQEAKAQFGAAPEAAVNLPLSVDISAVETDRFCDFCDSKGVKHKKNCTRPV